MSVIHLNVKNVVNTSVSLNYNCLNASTGLPQTDDTPL